MNLTMRDVAGLEPRCSAFVKEQHDFPEEGRGRALIRPVGHLLPLLRNGRRDSW
jgi:hypothetical protein